MLDHFDETAEYTVTTDASIKGLGAILSQKGEVKVAKKRGGKYALRLVLLKDFDYEIVYGPGKFNVVADDLTHKLEPSPEALPLDDNKQVTPYVISSACSTPCSIDKTELAFQQQIDPYVSNIMVALESSVPSPWIKEFKASQGVLYRCNEEQGNRLLRFIPAVYHREVISSCHSNSFFCSRRP